MSSTAPIKPERKRGEEKRREERKRGEEKRRGEEETKGKEKRGEEGSRSHASIPAVCVDAVGGSTPTSEQHPHRSHQRLARLRDSTMGAGADR